MDTVIIYAMGDFFYKYKNEICKKYKIIGGIDRGLDNTFCTEMPVYKSIYECNLNFDYILIMTEKPLFIFEIIEKLKKAQIPYLKVIFGNSLYGKTSGYLRVFLNDKYQIVISSVKEQYVVHNIKEYIDYIKSMCVSLIEDQCVSLKRKLQCLYQKQMDVLWMDEDVSCVNHDIDVYLRYEKEGYFNWGMNATFFLAAIKMFSNPYVLDIGCGDGYYFWKLFRFIKGINYVGCDINSSNINIAKRHTDNLDNCEWIIADIMTEMPKPKLAKYYDTAIWNGFFSVFDDNEQDIIISQIAERLGARGIFVVCDYFSSMEKSNWKYSKNSSYDSIKLRDKFQKYFVNICLHIDEQAKGFCLLASNSLLPFYN